MTGKRCCRLLTLICICTICLTGCWNSRELTDMAIVVGMGIDVVADSEDYRVTFQMVNSGALPSGTRSSGTGQMQISVFTEQADSIFGALRKISHKVPRRLFFGHIQLVVIGEEAARKGIAGLLDYFERSHEVRLNSTVLISRQTSAEDVIGMVTPLEKIPAVGIVKKTRTTSDVWAENMNVNITDVINDLVSSGEPAIGGIQIRGDRKIGDSNKNLQKSKPPAQLVVRGVSIMKDGKLTGWLDGRTARGVLWTRDKLKSTVVGAPCPDTTKHNLIIVVHSKTTKKTSFEKGKPVFTIHIKEEGNLGETQCLMDLESEDTIIQIQRKWEEETKKDVLAAVKEAQRRHSDILDFGSVIQRKYPKIWKKMEKDWPRIFSECEVRVQVEAYLRLTGMRSNSFQYQKKKMEEKAAQK